MSYGRHLYARVTIDLQHNPQLKLDLMLQLLSLARLAALPTPAARRRAYRRIPKAGWQRAVHREMAGLAADVALLRMVS